MVTIQNLQGDFVRTDRAASAFLDAGRDAHVVMGTSAITSMSVYASNDNPLGLTESLGIAQVGSGTAAITLSDAVLKVGTRVFVGGVEIGQVEALWDDSGFKVAFNTDAGVTTVERLDALLHALTYTNQSAIGTRNLTVKLQDSSGSSSADTAVVTLPASAIHAQSNQPHRGTEQADLYFVDASAQHISIAAGGGTDTLLIQPTGGGVYLTSYVFTSLSGIDEVRALSASDFIIDASSLSGITNSISGETDQLLSPRCLFLNKALPSTSPTKL